MEEKRVKRRRKRRPRRKVKIYWGRIFLTLGVLIAIIGALVFGGYNVYKIYESKKANNTNVAVTSVKTKPKTQILEQESLDKPMYILVVGVEQLKNNLINSLYLVSVNKEGKQLDLIGIPLDSKIVGRDGKSLAKIKTMYTTGGLELTKAIVEDIFHIQIPYYVVYNEQTFQDIAAIVGENKMYVEHNMTQYDESGIDISLLQGYQKMDVTKAWAYMSYEGSGESGIEKIQRQERLVKNQIDSNWDNNTLGQIIKVWRHWGKLETNISTADAIKFIFTRKDIPKENYHYFILPGAKEKIEQTTYWDIDPIEAQRLVGITINYNGGINDK